MKSIINNLRKIRFVAGGEHWGVIHDDFPERALPISQEEVIALRDLNTVITLRDELLKRYYTNERSREILKLWGVA